RHTALRPPGRHCPRGAVLSRARQLHDRTGPGRGWRADTPTGPRLNSIWDLEPFLILFDALADTEHARGCLERSAKDFIQWSRPLAGTGDTLDGIMAPGYAAPVRPPCRPLRAHHGGGLCPDPL